MRCEQCGREGTRGFTVWPETPVTLGDGAVQIIPEFTMCSNKSACRRRWPKHPAHDE